MAHATAIEAIDFMDMKSYFTRFEISWMFVPKKTGKSPRMRNLE